MIAINTAFVLGVSFGTAGASAVTGVHMFAGIVFAHLEAEKPPLYEQSRLGGKPREVSINGIEFAYNVAFEAIRKQRGARLALDWFLREGYSTYTDGSAESQNFVQMVANIMCDIAKQRAPADAQEMQRKLDECIWWQFISGAVRHDAKADVKRYIDGFALKEVGACIIAYEDFIIEKYERRVHNISTLAATKLNKAPEGIYPYVIALTPFATSPGFAEVTLGALRRRCPRDGRQWLIANAIEMAISMVCMTAKNQLCDLTKPAHMLRLAMRSGRDAIIDPTEIYLAIREALHKLTKDASLKNIATVQHAKERSGQAWDRWMTEAHPEVVCTSGEMASSLNLQPLDEQSGIRNGNKKHISLPTYPAIKVKLSTDGEYVEIPRSLAFINNEWRDTGHTASRHQASHELWGIVLRNPRSHKYALLRQILNDQWIFYDLDGSIEGNYWDIIRQNNGNKKKVMDMTRFWCCMGHVKARDVVDLKHCELVLPRFAQEDFQNGGPLSRRGCAVD
jgi:hypothetical protein